MKKFIFAVIFTMAGAAYAVAPSTSCPTGFITVVEKHILLTDASCPAGYISVGAVESCLVSSQSGACMMYVPGGVSYTDESGTYQYDTMCQLE